MLRYAGTRGRTGVQASKGGGPVREKLAQLPDFPAVHRVREGQRHRHGLWQVHAGARGVGWWVKMEKCVCAGVTKTHIAARSAIGSMPA